jgi:hypothetical protein
MYLERILENAETEWEEYTYCTRDLEESEHPKLDEDSFIGCTEWGKISIENCKNYLNAFKNPKEKFIFLFDVFLHINSIENFEVSLNGEIYPNGYKVFGFKELNKKDIEVNRFYFDWLNRELLSFDFKDSVQDEELVLGIHYFHQILNSAFFDLIEMKNFIYDTTKPQKKVFVWRLQKTFYVYEFQNHTENELELFFRSKIEKYEEPTLKIAYMVSVIEYLSMYNQYTEDGKERPLNRSANHKALTKIYNYLTKNIEKIDFKTPASRGRPKINKQENDYRLNWKGTHPQLADLIYELNKKGWIDQIEETKNVSELIMGLFKVKESESLISYQQNLKKSVHDEREENRDDKNKNYFSKIDLFKKYKK